MGEIRNAYNILFETPEGKRPRGRSSVDGRIILERILGKQGGKVWTAFTWLRIGTSAGLL
jgi:hypothetical protein